ncbi:MAG TPA: cell division protein FtsH, partial [Anaerolineales bacterium]|nr:cell division protein FtsH [Anaerolineales bacterium]
RRVLMGGRAAEEIFIHSITTGAENDLRQATTMARKMVVDWGMSDRLGRVALSSEGAGYLGDDPYAPRAYSEATAREIDEEIRALVEDAYTDARDLLQEHAAVVERIVARLVEQEEISGAELLALMQEA